MHRSGTPPPPWNCRIEAVTWVHRAVPGAREALPAPFQHQGTISLTAGGLLRYVASPVGPYAEVLGAPLLLRAPVPLGHVPFIAVDSVASMHGGREHWALPKTLATVGDDGRVHGDGWSLRVATRPAGPALPVVLPFAFTQTPGTRARCLFRGSARLARVHVDATGTPPWMVPGGHLGALVRGRLGVGPPRATSP